MFENSVQGSKTNKQTHTSTYRALRCEIFVLVSKIKVLRNIRFFNAPIIWKCFQAGLHRNKTVLCLFEQSDEIYTFSTLSAVDGLSWARGPGSRLCLRMKRQILSFWKEFCVAFWRWDDLVVHSQSKNKHDLLIQSSFPLRVADLCCTLWMMMCWWW